MRHLVIMMKEPVPGRVKTRLAADIGKVPAAWWFRHQCAGLVRKLGRDPRWQCWLAVAPDRALASRALPGGVPRLSQGRGDLGARMRRVFENLPPGPALVVGGDIPGIGPREIWRGFEALASAEVVFGPALDGGYWMVGTRAGPALKAGFLRGVRWSTDTALSDSIGSLGTGARIAMADRLRDVDTIADLRALAQRGHGKA